MNKTWSPVALGAIFASLLAAGGASAAAHHEDVNGTVASITSASFTVQPKRGNPVTVNVTASTLFRDNNGDADTFAGVEAGEQVQVSGIADGTAIDATHVEIDVVQHVSISGVIVSVSGTTPALTLVVQRPNRVQETVTTTVNTSVRKNDGTVGAFADLVAGLPVQLGGIQTGTASIQANWILEIVVQHVDIEGQVDNLSTSSFEIVRQGGLQVLIDVDSNTEYRNPDGTVGSFSDVTLNTEVEVRGTQNPDGSVEAALVLIGEPSQVTGFVTNINATAGTLLVQPVSGAAVTVDTNANTVFYNNDGSSATFANITTGMEVDATGPEDGANTILAYTVVLIVAKHLGLDGTVASIDTTNDDFQLQELSGTNIQVDWSNSTLFQTSAGKSTTAADLAVADSVEVFGVANPDGSLQTTRVIIVVTQTVRLEGPVVSINATALTFTVSPQKDRPDVTIDTNASTVFSNNNGTSAAFASVNTSQAVTVVGTQNPDGSIQAQKVVIHVDVSLDGAITSVNGSTSFVVRRNGGLSTTVDVDGNTQYSNNNGFTFQASEIQAGAEVVVTGVQNLDGSVLATTVEVVVTRKVTVHGTIDSLTASGFTVKPLHGADLVIDLTDDTTFRNNNGSAFSQSELIIGTIVTVTGTQNADGSITAETVEVFIH